MARFGILTGGGDCPGLNAVIRGVVRAGVNRYGHQIIGFRYGWAGVLEANTVELTAAEHLGHPAPRRHDPRHVAHEPLQATAPTAPRSCARRSSARAIDALIPIGGEDTLGVAGRLSADGVPVVGVPKTIDNDLAGTDVTFGFHTAVQIATDAIDRLHTTAESHNRVIVVEVMGRHAGWIAAYSGIAGGADVILVPERPFDIDEVCERIKRRHARRHARSRSSSSPRARVPRDGSGITTAGAKTDAFGHARLGGIAVALEREIEARTGFETRMTILGHVQRGGTPTAYDRVLATRFGVQGGRGGRPRRVGHDGLAARHGHRPGPAGRRGGRAQAPRRRSLRHRRGVLRVARPPGRRPDRVATLAGCAACRRSSSSSPSRSWPPAAAPTRKAANDYVDAVNKAQNDFAAKFDQLSGQITSTSTAAQDRQTLDGFKQAIDKVVTDFRAVKAPDKVKALHDQLIAEISAYGTRDRQGQGGVRRRGPAGDRQGAGRSRQRRDAGPGADQHDDRRHQQEAARVTTLGPCSRA